jgi:hypothetical protein
MPAGMTYTPIARTTLTSTAATVTFSSIPQTYTDLVVSIGIVGLSAQETPKMYFNGDTSALYSTTFLDGGGSVLSNRTTAQGSFYGIGAYNSGNPTGVSSILVNINNYYNSTTFKTMLSRNAASTLSSNVTVGLYRSTAAVSSISFIVHGGNSYLPDSTFTLYGILAA